MPRNQQKEVSKALEKKGFYLFRNACTTKDIKYARSCMKDKMVQYSLMECFLQNTMISCINTALKWDCVFTKYRVSNNNNGSDAGAFHRDLIKYDTNKLEPFYTCLTYLDDTVMEVISKSHRQPHMSNKEAISQYQKNRLRLKMNAGDILFFHACLLHRGIFTEGLTHRRLIQIFEVYPNQELFDKFSPNIIHIPPSIYSQQTSGISQWIFQNPCLAEVCNWFGYLNSATGYGWDKESDKSDGLVYSSEGTRPRLIPTGGWEPGNQYILVQKVKTASNILSKILGWKLYTRQYISYLGT